MTDMGHGRHGFSGDVLRLFVASAVAVLLLAGGVYWLHRLPDGRASPENGSTVQVQLLLTTEPTPYAASEPPEQRPADSVGSPDTPPQLQAKSNQEEELVVHEQATSAVQAPSEPRSSVRSPHSQKTAASSEMALRFQQALLRHIARFQRYPTAARSSGMEGTVRVVFVLQRDGRVLDAWIETSSGKQLLDREAVETIFRAAPLPEIPAELPGQMRVLLPVDFALP